MKNKVVIVLTLIVMLALIRQLFGQSIINITNRLPKHPSKVFPRRVLNQIQKIIVHHAAGPIDQTLTQITNYHIGPNHVCADGCPGVLYHYAILRSGKIYQINELETIAWHIAGQNTRSVGIVFIGNYENYPATKAQLKALRKVIRTIERKVGRSLELSTHRGECPGCTECPGDYLQAQIETA